MAYNKRVLKKATKNLSKKKTLAKPKDIIKDPEGQWKFPGQPTRIPGSDITMQGVPYPVLGVGSTGQKQMMYPNQEYQFPGSTYVDEFPPDKDAMNAMMKARLAYANEFGNPAAQRMITLPDNLYDFGDGNMGSHYMASMDNYAVPQIQDVNGKLVLGDFGPESNEAIRFDRPEDAEYFAEHYKDVSPAFIEAELTDEEIEEYKKGGYVIEEIGEDPPVYPLYYTEGLSKRINLRNLKSKYKKGQLVSNPEWENYLKNNLEPGLLERWEAEQTTPEENDLVQMAIQERKNIPMYLDQEHPEYAKYVYELLKSKYKKLDQGGFVELDLTPEEIQQYVDGGYVVEELPKAQDGKDLKNVYLKTKDTAKYPKLIRKKEKFFKGTDEYLKDFDTGKKAKYLDYDEEKTIKQNLKKQIKAYKKDFKELEKVDKIGSWYLKRIDPKYLNYTVGGLEDYGQYIDPYTRAYLMSKPDYKPEEEKTLNPYSILNTRQGYSAIRDAKNRGEISQGAWNRYLRYYGGRKFDPLRYDLTPEQQRRWEQEWGRPGEMTKFVTDYLDPLAKIIPAAAMTGALGPLAIEEAAGILSTPGKDLWKYGVTGVRNFLNTAPKGVPWASIGNTIGLGFGAEAAMNLPENIRKGNDAEAIVDAVMMATSPGMPNVLSKAYNFTKALTNPTTKALVNLPGKYTAGIKTPFGSEIYLGNTKNLTGAKEQILQKFTGPFSQASGTDIKIFKNVGKGADGSKELQVVSDAKTGYVPQLQLSGSTALGLPQPFQSEINWAKWNKDIPNNKPLMEEYLAIEESTKANGTWMKNPDGSVFEGTPEQFVQQQSQNFKKAFPEGYNTMYRGDVSNWVNKERGNPTLTKRYTGPESEGTSVFMTPSEEVAKAYADGQSRRFGEFVEGDPTDLPAGGLYELAVPKTTQTENLNIYGQGNTWTQIPTTEGGVEVGIAQLDQAIAKQEERISVLEDNFWEAWIGQKRRRNYSGGEDISTEEAKKLAENEIKKIKEVIKKEKDLKNKLIENKDKYATSEDLAKIEKELSDLRGYENDPGILATDDFSEYLQATPDLKRINIDNIRDSAPQGDIVINKHIKGNYGKSKVGNDGMFDMTNPNIYKSLLPLVGTAGAAAAAAASEEDIDAYTMAALPLMIFGKGKKINLKKAFGNIPKLFSDTAVLKNGPKIKGLRLGVTQQDVQNVVNKNINYIKSDEYMTRRMSNTGESKDEILKDIDKYINKLKNTTIDLNKSLLFSPFTAGLAKMRTNKIQVARGLEDKETILDVLDHEIKHMLSPATELSRSTRAKKYSTYPKIDIGGPDPYNYFKDPAEQQVRMLKLNENIRKDLGIKGDRKITKKEFDKWQASASNKILNDPAYRDFKLLYKNMSEEGKKDLLKNLNKAWGLVPPAIILGAAAADDENYSPGEIATAGLLGFITRGKVKGKGLSNLSKLSRFIGKTPEGTLLTELSKTTKAPLNKIKQINAENIISEKVLPFGLAKKINPEFQNKNYIPIYAEEAKASKTSNLPTQKIVDTYADDGDIIKLNPERVEQFEKYQDNLAKFALDFNTIWREGELGNNTKKLTKNVNKLLQEQEELERIGRPAFEEANEIRSASYQMINDYEKAYWPSNAGYTPSEGLTKAQELIKQLEAEMELESTMSSERKKAYGDVIEILNKHINELAKDATRVLPKKGIINLMPGDSGLLTLLKDDANTFTSLRRLLAKARVDSDLAKIADNYDKRILPLSWEIDAEASKINILDILEPDVRQRVEALRDMPDPPTPFRGVLSSLETRGTLNKVNITGMKTSALAKGRAGDSSLKGTNLQDETQETLNSIGGRADAFKGAVTLRTKPWRIPDTFLLKNPGTDDAIERVYEVWSKGENPQLEGYINYTRDLYKDPKTVSETVAHEDAHVFQQLYGYLKPYYEYVDKYKYHVPKKGTKTGDMLSKVLTDPVEADPKGRQKHASWLSSPIELDANLVAERLNFARNKFIEAKQANPNATQEELLKDIIKDMKLPENRKKFIEDLMSSPEGNIVQKHFLSEFRGAIDPVKDSTEVIAGKEFARQFLEMLPVLLIGLGLGSSMSGEGYKKGGSVDIELDEEQVQDYIRKGYILDEL